MLKSSAYFVWFWTQGLQVLCDVAVDPAVLSAFRSDQLPTGDPNRLRQVNLGPV